MACDETEVRNFPDPRPVEGLEVVARRWSARSWVVWRPRLLSYSVAWSITSH